MRVFQGRVNNWMTACFKKEVINCSEERALRFLEEAVELVQTLNVSKEQAHNLVDYVYGREEGVTRKEVGGAIVTLGALCNTLDIDLYKAGEEELERVWMHIEKIRKKHRDKSLVGITSSRQEVEE